MATPTFPKINFSQIKASLADRVGTHVKNAGPQRHLNVKLRSDDDGSERWNWEATMMALNAELKTDDGDSEPQNWKMRLWTSNWKSMMALNSKTKNVTLNVKLRSDDGSERRNWKMRLWTSNWKPMMALNAKTENVTLNIKLRSDDGSKRRNWERDSRYRAKDKQRLWTLNRRYASKCQGNDAALNVELKVWLWMLNRKERVALNAKLERDGDSEHQTGQKWWLWTPK